MKVRYRVWLSAEKIMVYPDNERGDSCFNAAFALNQKGELIAYFQDKCSGETHWYGNLSAAEPMLSTGRFDKEGKEIWDGDIIKVTFLADDKDEFTETKIVSYFPKLTKWVAHPIGLHVASGTDLWWNLDDKCPVVIGNVKENPELKEGE